MADEKISGLQILPSFPLQFAERQRNNYSAKLYNYSGFPLQEGLAQLLDLHFQDTKCGDSGQLGLTAWADSIVF
jgi:hypothetical protein